MAETLRMPLRVVFYREKNQWIAHCLEFDLIGSGDTREASLDQLTKAIFLQIEASVEHQNPENLFSPAEGKVFRMFSAGTDVATGTLALRPIKAANVEIDRAECREYLGAEPIAPISA